MSHETAELTASLQACLSAIWGKPAVVQGLSRLSGGASRHTWSLDAAPIGERPRPFVLRCDPPGRPDPEQMAREARVLTAAAASGVPVPRVIDYGDGHDGGGAAASQAYILMDRIEGETVPRRLLRDDRYAAVRPGLPAQFGRILAQIHSIPTDSVPGLSAEDPLRQLVTIYRAFDEPRPAIELGLQWLAQHRPPERPATVVHGDFRNGNLIVGPEGVRAVLDWELVHLGNPIEDLGWLCVKAWRFGNAHPVGGFGSRQDLLAAYADVSGIRPDDDELHWWEVFGTVRWAVLCRLQAERFFSGDDRSIEYAVLGRRVCEQEHDILLALRLTESVPAPDILTDPLDDERDADSDRPDADALLEAVHDFLTTQVAPNSEARQRFLAKVAANAVAIARREIRQAPAKTQRQKQLSLLGCANDRELAEALRCGSIDAHDPDVLRAIRTGVTARLAVANPAYLQQSAS
ncbi:phosphotransferase family protein [Nocardia sp. NPDC059246]|uniref:phosphotransferase family protein n=1 Tax=unclassified Nocardia TaxID=2637762 RepID=UPI0036835F97